MSAVKRAASECGERGRRVSAMKKVASECGDEGGELVR